MAYGVPDGLDCTLKFTDSTVAEYESATQLLLDQVRWSTTLISVDAWSDHSQSFGPELLATLRFLKKLDASQHRWRPTGMGVRLDPLNDEHWEVARRFCPWSIHADFWTDDYVAAAAQVHDASEVVFASSCVRDAKRLRVDLPKSVSIAEWSR